MCFLMVIRDPCGVIGMRVPAHTLTPEQTTQSTLLFKLYLTDSKDAVSCGTVRHVWCLLDDGTKAQCCGYVAAK